MIIYIIYIYYRDLSTKMNRFLIDLYYLYDKAIDLFVVCEMNKICFVLLYNSRMNNKKRYS